MTAAVAMPQAGLFRQDGQNVIPFPAGLPRPQPKALRPYQADAISKVRDSIRQGKRKVVLCLPTGAGKTVVAGAIVRGALAKGGRAVFTAPMISLIDQTLASFEAEGLGPLGAMQAQHPRTDPTAPVQVASIQTLDRRTRQSLPDASVVLVDEAHIRANVVRRWMKERPDLVFVGLTATPGRAGMASEWDDLVVGVTVRELIDQGFLSRFAVYAPSTADLSGVRVVKGEYDPKGAEAAMEEGGLVGDILDNYVRRGEGRPTLGFAVSVAHAVRMAREFTEAGIPSAYVDHTTDTLERQAIARQFRRGDLRVIWSVRTMTTGVDLPVSGIIDAAPTHVVADPSLVAEDDGGLSDADLALLAQFKGTLG